MPGEFPIFSYTAYWKVFTLGYSQLGVTPGMLGEMVTPHESLLTQWATELLFPSVGPVVAGQLIRPGKPPVAALPGALVGLLARMSPQVSF